MRSLCHIALYTAFSGTLLKAEEPEVKKTDDPLLKGPGLKVNLVAETATITPGVPLKVGFHIEHFPGFHTYWLNPGMVGMATTLDWKLPEGFTASEIRWPAPENSFMGTYPCHGYERDVTLLVTITPPKTIEAKEVTLTTEAGWMCCARGCFPGFKTLSLTLPVAGNPVPAPKHQALIEKAEKELPSTNHRLTASLLTKMDAPVIKIRFAGRKDWPAKDIYFFSNDGQISSEHAQKFEPQPDGSVILTIPRSEFSPEKKTDLPGVLRIGKDSFALTAKP
ncbi:MAG: protein-disulfide reductase DsbD family protein [Akkermansiaceae bacterium]